jgi:hypothetical protein
MEGPLVTAQDVQMQIPISVSRGDPKLEFRLRLPVFQPIDAPMGQQHRTRAKRRRRRAYLQRKKTSLHSARREPAKPRAKKEPVTPE